MAKIPDELFKSRGRTLADLKPGERAPFPLALISVDDDRNAFISASAELGPPYDKRLEYGEVWLDEDGKYHVDLKDATEGRFEPKEVGLFVKYGLMKPIESIRWSRNESGPSDPNPNLTPNQT